MTDTLAAPATHLLEVRHSRFIVHAAPVPAPDAAHAFLAAVEDADATHNCWAYRIDDAYRSSDDGEPAGTAGRPILAAIDGQGFDQVMVVVTVPTPAISAVLVFDPCSWFLLTRRSSEIMISVWSGP